MEGGPEREVPVARTVTGREPCERETRCVEGFFINNGGGKNVHSFDPGSLRSIERTPVYHLGLQFKSVRLRSRARLLDVPEGSGEVESHGENKKA